MVLFLWNEVGGMLRVRTPFSVILQTVGNWFDALLGTGYFGANLLRSLLLGKGTDLAGMNMGSSRKPSISCF